MDRLERNLHLKIYFGDSEMDEKDTSLIIPSEWRPKPQDIPQWIDTRMAKFNMALKAIFVRRRVPSNLLPFQLNILDDLRANDGIVIANTDKGLGPCAIELERYIRDALIHLKNEDVYEILSEEEAMASVEDLKQEIEEWLDEYENVIDKDAHHYISKHLLDNKDPFGYFYLLYKIHKLSSLEGVDAIPTRPICSSSGSIDHPLGAWVNEQLQTVAQAQPSFFPNSNALLTELRALDIPPNAQQITADATTLYTSIPTDPALLEVSTSLKKHKHKFGYNVDALINALKIVFKNNYFKFGDLFIKQKSGTAVGPVVCPSPYHSFV